MASMTAVWTTIGVLALVGAAIKAAGPVLVGGRELPGWASGVIALLAPALLSALVLVDTFGSDRALVLDARAAGLGAAILAIALRAPLLVVVVGAAAVTAATRALT
jgi:branched-subunit amino acid transport protein